MAEVSNVVLAHGAWADGSSWAKLIPQLDKAGLNAVAIARRKLRPRTKAMSAISILRRARLVAFGDVPFAGVSSIRSKEGSER
jgi:hypothetical protein